MDINSAVFPPWHGLEKDLALLIRLIENVDNAIFVSVFIIPDDTEFLWWTDLFRHYFLPILGDDGSCIPAGGEEPYMHKIWRTMYGHGRKQPATIVKTGEKKRA